MAKRVKSHEVKPQNIDVKKIDRLKLFVKLTPKWLLVLFPLILIAIIVGIILMNKYYI